MSSVVFILGAGASAQCGAPVMSNFLDVAATLLLGEGVGDRRADFERVFNAIGGLQAVHSKAQLDLNNIEAVFTVLELGRIIQRVPGMEPTAIPLTIASLKELIVETLEQTIRFPTHSAHILPPQPYESFANLVDHLRGSAFPRQTVSVITFNYDVAADVALFRGSLGPNYSLGDPASKSGDVPLLKLHGSLNWATDRAAPHTIRPLHLREYFSKYTIRFPRSERSLTTLPIGSQLAEYFEKYSEFVVQDEPVIVPPSWNKADYHNALSNVWASAATHLSEAEYVFVIGYSLPETDSFFRHLYALGSVGKAPLRKIAVYNPEEAHGGVDTRFRALLGPAAAARYEYHATTFDNAITLIQNTFPARTN